MDILGTYKRQIAIILVLMVVTYVIRLLWWNALQDVRPPIGWAVVMFCIVGTPIIAFISLIVVGFTYSRRKQLEAWLTCRNFIVGFIAIVLTMIFPLPEPRPLPELQHFEKYHASYDYVVELARTGGLDDSSRDFCKRPPPDLIYVSEGGCVYINSFNDGLKVEFQPIDKTHYKIIYIENDSDITHCGHRAHIAEKLDEHWYACWQEW